MGLTPPSLLVQFGAAAVLLAALAAAQGAHAAAGAANTPPSGAAAQGFTCPAPTSIPGVKISPTEMKSLYGLSDADLTNHIDILINRIRTQNPNIRKIKLVDVLHAAYCPVVANLSRLDREQKQAEITRFDGRVMEELAKLSGPAPQDQVVVTAPVSPGVMQRLQQQAAAHHMSVQQWVATLLDTETKGSGK